MLGFNRRRCIPECVHSACMICLVLIYDVDIVLQTTIPDLLNPKLQQPTLKPRTFLNPRRPLSSSRGPSEGQPQGAEAAVLDRLPGVQDEPRGDSQRLGLL